MPQVLLSPTLQLVVFRVAEQQYALPLKTVDRVLALVAIAALPQAPPSIRGVINVHGTIVPVLDMHRLCGFAMHEYTLATRLLLVRTARRLLALAVDEALGVLEVAAAAVAAPQAVLPGMARVAGIVALSDGLLLIHDLDTFLSLPEEQQLTDAMQEREPCH